MFLTIMINQDCRWISFTIMINDSVVELPEPSIYDLQGYHKTFFIIMIYMTGLNSFSNSSSCGAGHFMRKRE